MNETRRLWLNGLLKIARPVLDALSEGRLKELMPVRHHPDSHDRPEYTYLEAFGRTMTGLAPWLEHPCEDPEEESLRVRTAALSRRALRMAVDPASPDCMNFENGYQPIVDAAFLAQAILRAPGELFRKLDAETAKMLIEKMKHTRSHKPYPNNWLLFSGISMLVGSFDLQRFGMRGWGWLTALGVLLAVFGFSTFFNPVAGAAVLTVMTGLLLILQGAAAIARGCLTGRFWL